VIELESVSKRYGEGSRAVWALRDVSLRVRRREFLSVMGPSGSGKSSLLNLIAGLDTPNDGAVRVGGAVVARLSDHELARMRRSTVTVIFQFFNLLPTLTAEQNVAVPLRADGRSRRETRERVARALAAVAMTERARHYPSELSGGEMQRVAIARALATDAQVVLADEPTGNLDSARGEEILELLREAVDREGRTVVMVTHDVRAAAYGDRIITLRDGLVVDEVAGAGRAARIVPLELAPS